MIGELVRKDIQSPLSIASDQLWEGNDGPWSPFFIGFGSPAQYLRVLASTSNWQPYVVLPGGCIASDTSGCQTARGGMFHTNESSTWANIGDFTLGTEMNLGIDDAGDFGFDNLTLGLPDTGTSPNIGHQVVVGVVAKDFFLGSIGLRPAPTNFSNFDNPIPSLLQTLKTAQYIPSLSWGYTAGSYQIGQINKNGHGSLVLGGYDAARFIPNDIKFEFADDTSRDLVVGLLSMELGDSSQSFLDKPILAFLDSGVSHIWLPESACDRLASRFNLTYDENTDLYLVNNTVHESLVAQNATIAFTLNNNLTVGATSSPVTINLPYSAFDLQLTEDYPNNKNNATHYFPLRRAANSTQYTLGRTFFQHAYVVADYERSQFSVYQALFSDGDTNLQPIYPPAPENTTKLATGSIAGIAVGGFVAIMLILAGIRFWCLRRNRTRKVITSSETELESSVITWKGISELHGLGQSAPELPTKTTFGFQELAGEEAASEMSAKRPRYELPG